MSRRRRVRAAALLPAVLLGSLAAATSAGASPATIQSGYNGKCLDGDLNAMSRNGTRVQLWTCNGTLQQQWYVDTDGPVTRIRSAYSGRCMEGDLNTLNGNPGAVQLWDCHGDSWQRWTIAGATIFNNFRQQVLDADIHSANRDGGIVQLWLPPNGEPQQQWYITPTPASISTARTEVAVADGEPATTSIEWSAPSADAVVWASVDGGPKETVATGASGTVNDYPVAVGRTVLGVSWGVDPDQALARTTVIGTSAQRPSKDSQEACDPHADEQSGTTLTATFGRSFAANPRRTTTVDVGRSVRVSGMLRDADRSPVAGAEVCVRTQEERAGATPQVLEKLKTDGDGRFTYLIPPGPSRTVWLVQARERGGAASRLRLQVRPRVSVRPARPRLRNGETLVLRGRVSRPIPQRGVFVLLQVWQGVRWQTFASARTRSDGTFSARHAFRFTEGDARFTMRAVLPTQASYAYTNGRSRNTVIRVRG